MNPAVIAQLLATFGPAAISLIDALIVKIEQNGNVSAEEWQGYRNNAMQSAQQLLLQRVTLAGLDPKDPKVAALLAMAQ